MQYVSDDEEAMMEMYAAYQKIEINEESLEAICKTAKELIEKQNPEIYYCDFKMKLTDLY